MNNIKDISNKMAEIQISPNELFLRVKNLAIGWYCKEETTRSES